LAFKLNSVYDEPMPITGPSLLMRQAQVIGARRK